MKDQQSRAAVETRLVHDLHRTVTKLLADAATRPMASAAALAEVRDFLVSQLPCHHESEDALIWPLITAKEPEIAGRFADLSGEHVRLETALQALATAPVADSDRTALAKAAAAVRDLVHTHLEHEEAVLFPALRDHVTEQEWLDVAEKVIAGMPDVEMHLAVEFLEQVGTPQEADIILAAMPAPVRDELREQARATLNRLGEGASV
ncbi:hemerythrin domain-containing protein [Streptomyces sp. TS71-3]|uniref:hemerythrin domain-containing protein n=1 Tax=Streptomyces sp. TS71-3 TaxID=2733862 RepID=UPI001B2383FC|nr:hemerythrin domain-containing protein [Streptomyces sp. TS71-3]GHJ41924.1 hypothetical protein Sm713_75330 [Streptomyces sp. TS71-3]